MSLFQVLFQCCFDQEEFYGKFVLDYDTFPFFLNRFSNSYINILLLQYHKKEGIFTIILKKIDMIKSFFNSYTFKIIVFL